MDIEIKGSQADVNLPITLTPDQSSKFQAAIKIGLYKELHKKGLLTDEQLKQLMSLQNI
ncbi:MAG: hypothetical protein PHC91_04650 [Eubacteriales bacterium]|nr:hypothetical protein [Eubacteriales bacterium]